MDETEDPPVAPSFVLSSSFVGVVTIRGMPKSKFARLRLAEKASERRDVKNG